MPEIHPLAIVEKYEKTHDGSKTIIVNFDGTNGKPAWGVQDKEPELFSNGTGLSNPCKLHLIAGGNIGNTHKKWIDQIPLYYTGVGTRGVTGIGDIMYASLLSGVAMNNVAEIAAKDVKKIYYEGDQLFVFGFSRGAAIARLCVSYMKKNFPEMKVKMLGVWDTVVESFMYGISTNIGNVSVEGSSKLPDNVEHAVHLCSVDEDRRPMMPTLFNKDERVKEIWCPGNHSDIGGSYYYDGLSDITLTCMIHEAKKHGMKTREITEDLCKNPTPTLIDADPDNTLAKQLKVDVGKFTKYDKDMKIEPNALDLERHSAMSRTMAVYNYSRGFNGRHVRVMKDDKDLEDEPILLLDAVVDRAKNLTYTEEEKAGLEASSGWIKDTKYRPHNLVGVKFKLVNSTDMSISDKVYEGIEKEVADW